MNNTVILTLPDKKITKAGDCLADVMAGIKVSLLKEILLNPAGLYSWHCPVMNNKANKDKVKDFLKKNIVKISFKASKRKVSLTKEEISLWSKIGNKLFGVPLSNDQTWANYYSQPIDIDINKQLWKEYAKICWYRYGASRATDIRKFCSNYEKYGNIWVPYCLLEINPYFESRYKICCCPNVCSGNTVLIENSNLIYFKKEAPKNWLVSIEQALALKTLAQSRKKSGATLSDRFLDTSDVSDFDLSNQIRGYRKKITDNWYVVVNKNFNEKTAKKLNDLFSLPLYKLQKEINGK